MGLLGNYTAAMGQLIEKISILSQSNALAKMVTSTFFVVMTIILLISIIIVLLEGWAEWMKKHKQKSTETK